MSASAKPLEIVELRGVSDHAERERILVGMVTDLRQALLVERQRFIKMCEALQLGLGDAEV